MTIRRALWGIFILLLILPPRAHPASSDAFPWSGAPTSSPSVGLFTPSSPGNSAACNAPLTGGQAGSPIVSGNGANLRITVPMATPSVVPAYQQYTNGGMTGPLGNTASGVATSSSTVGALDSILYRQVRLN